MFKTSAVPYVHCTCNKNFNWFLTQMCCSGRAIFRENFSQRLILLIPDQLILFIFTMNALYESKIYRNILCLSAQRCIYRPVYCGCFVMSGVALTINEWIFYFSSDFQSTCKSIPKWESLWRYYANGYQVAYATFLNRQNCLYGDRYKQTNVS